MMSSSASVVAACLLVYLLIFLLYLRSLDLKRFDSIYRLLIKMAASYPALFLSYIELMAFKLILETTVVLFLPRASHFSLLCWLFERGLNSSASPDKQLMPEFVIAESAFFTTLIGPFTLGLSFHGRTLEMLAFLLRCLNFPCLCSILIFSCKFKFLL